MLEKNKDYIELSMRSMMKSHEPCQVGIDINITGISPEYRIFDTKNPFDIPCDVVVVPKRTFDRLQANVGINEELAKQWETNYNLLLKKTGFDTVESLVFYLTNVGQSNTLLEALASLRDRAKYTCDEWKDLNRKLQECEKDYISERDKAEALEKENEELKKKLHEPDPFAEYKELLEKLHSKEDVEKFEWTLNHVCGGRGSVNGWIAVSLFWKQKYEALSKLVGFVTVEEIQDYLTNEADCDTLHEAISKLKDQVKYTCDEWYSANSRNNSWKAAAECNSPKELIEKIKGFREEIGIYSRGFMDWKEETGCPSPSAAKTMIESQASWCHAYHEIKAANEKLGDNIQKWKEMTKCETPEAAATWITSYEKACERGNELAEGAVEREKEWQDATGCIVPEAAKQYIERLKGRLNKIHGYSVDW